MKFHTNASWFLTAFMLLAYDHGNAVGAGAVGVGVVQDPEQHHHASAQAGGAAGKKIGGQGMSSSNLRPRQASNHVSEANGFSARSLQSLDLTDKKAKKSKMVGKKKKKKDKKSTSQQECGVDYCGTKPMNLGSMKTCLKSQFEHNSNLFFPEDEGYNKARNTAFSIARLPAAVVYVEDVDQVKAALACAVDNGYKVSARGGNHSYQGLATMDGFVVIDMGGTCKPDEFVIDKDDQGPHILEGSKYIGTMRGQAGCTNAVMLAMGHKHFKEEAGMTLIGSCPSVGITGFVLGGGGGDASPYIGYGADIVKEFQIVLYDGTVVKASEEENPDLYWASRGGGGGNGIITHLTYKVIQAPEQKFEDEQGGKKFTVLNFLIYPKDNMMEKAATRIQEWFYDADPLITGKFGGYFGWDGTAIPTTTTLYFQFVYLGSWKEAVEDLQATGLLDEDLFRILPAAAPFPRTGDSILAENHEVICTSSSPCPEFENTPGAMTKKVPGVEGSAGPAIRAYQFDSYGEAELFHMCVGLLFNGDPSFSNHSGDYCKDLGLDDDKCEDSSYESLFTIRTPKSCTDKDTIVAMLDAAGDPSSFINSHGPSPEFLALIGGDQLSESDLLNNSFEKRSSKAGSTMFQRFDDSFFAKLLNETAEASNHLQHGAALQVDADDTAYPWRNAALMIEYDSAEDADMFLSRLVEGGYTPQGYYAYLGPHGMKNWRSYFFDKKWRKLAKIRAKYDPTDVFGKPMTIESIGE